MTQIASKLNIESRDINTTTRTNYYHSTLKVLPLGSNHGNTSGWPLTLHSYINSRIRALDQPLIVQEHSPWFHMEIVVSSISSYSHTNRSYLIYGKKKIYLILPNLDQSNYLPSCLKKSSQNLVVCRWKSYLQWIRLNGTNHILICCFTEVNQKNDV